MNEQTFTYWGQTFTYAEIVARQSDIRTANALFGRSDDRATESAAIRVALAGADMSTRTVTLSESPNAPTVTAECTDEGWNGFHVPMLTAEELAAHYSALAQNDPNGTWSDVAVSVLHGVWIKMWDTAEDPEGDDAYVWHIDPSTGRAPIDGLCWVDPIAEV